MKFLIKTLIFTSLVLFTIASNLNNDCDNPCVACQRAVYQLKFHQIADCGESHCKNTCYKVRDLWNNSPGKIFEPFQKDIFGKCEICFRAGFCSIAECKAQQDAENEIISQIVNKATLTAKKTDFMGNNEFSAFRNDPLFYSPDRILAMDEEIEQAKDIIKKNLDASFAHNSAEGAIGEVKNVMNKLFSKDSVFAGKEVNNLKKKLNNISIEEESKAAQKYIASSKKYIDNIKQLLNINQNSSKLNHTEKQKLHSLISETKADLNSKIADSRKALKVSHDTKNFIVKKAVKDSLHEFTSVKHLLNKTA